VLSFTPHAYRLIITDMKMKTLFASDDHLEEWDGTHGGVPLPEGVYLWFLRVISPSGNEISRKGTITILFNR
jgi:hypothetical protein